MDDVTKCEKKRKYLHFYEFKNILNYILFSIFIRNKKTDIYRL